MKVAKVGYNTCKSVYNKLGTENARTALRIIKLFGEQDISPRISRLTKDTIELQFYNPSTEETGARVLTTQVYDFAKRVLNQYTAINAPSIEGVPPSKNNLTTVTFSDLKL